MDLEKRRERALQTAKEAMDAAVAEMMVRLKEESWHLPTAHDFNVYLHLECNTEYHEGGWHVTQNDGAMTTSRFRAPDLFETRNEARIARRSAT